MTMNIMTEVEVDLSEFGDEEIREEYEDRFGSATVSDEILDLIAEAARTSRHATRAYELIYAENSDVHSLDARQRLIAGRMGEAA